MDRLTIATEIARKAGALALDYYRRLDSLEVENKGHQDFVTAADRDVETLIRAELAQIFPEDGIVGEEHDDVPSRSSYTWVLDPIDGTANFIKSIPLWTVVIAVVAEDRTEVGVIYDPVHDDMYTAVLGQGAKLNDAPLRCPDQTITQGSVGIGFSNRTGTSHVSRAINAIIEEGGVFQRLSAGAISLVYVAAGRQVGYMEAHMNAWDCLAGQLIVAEAGGRIEHVSAEEMIAKGGRVVAGSPQTFDQLVRIADAAYTD